MAFRLAITALFFCTINALTANCYAYLSYIPVDANQTTAYVVLSVQESYGGYFKVLNNAITTASIENINCRGLSSGTIYSSGSIWAENRCNITRPFPSKITYRVSGSANLSNYGTSYCVGLITVYSESNITESER
jgi:hypothetical protein